MRQGQDKELLGFVKVKTADREICVTGFELKTISQMEAKV